MLLYELSQTYVIVYFKGEKMFRKHPTSDIIWSILLIVAFLKGINNFFDLIENYGAYYL